MTTPARHSAFPVTPTLDSTGSAGDLVQSLTYRETYRPTPAHPTRTGSAYTDPPTRRRLTADAPVLLRGAAGGAWALVSVVAAGSVVVVLVLVLVRVVGWLA